MRPVTVPATPPANTYDENAEAYIVVNYDGTRVTKSDLLIQMNEIILEWGRRGYPMHGGRVVWTDDTEEDIYRESAALLKAKSMDWGDARRALIETLGAYCSYCGAPIYSHLAIEHLQPKSLFPLQTFAWANFLLSCPSCNSIKGSKPNQTTVPGAPLDSNAAAAVITNQGALNYLWPHYAWASLTLPAPFPLKHELVWGNKQGETFVRSQAVTPTEAGELLKAYRQGAVEEENWVPTIRDGYRKRYFGVEVLVDPAWNDPVKTAAARMIDLMGLNRVVKVSNSAATVDRRLYDRTITWFKAMGVRQSLTEAVKLDPRSRALLPAAVAQAKLTIKASGFWGVWLAVMGQDTIAGTPFQQLLRSLMPGTANVDWTV